MEAGGRRRRRHGQAMVETALVLLVFLATLISILDFGQLLFIHQLMVERVRAAVRWGVVNPWDGSGNQIANVVLYNRPTAPVGATAFLGMSRANVSVLYSGPAATNPNDERITVSIVDYRLHFLSPWIAKTFRTKYNVVETAPIFYKP